MKDTPIRKLLSARLLVGRLGEADQFGWWRTTFFQQGSGSFLEPIFPRTSQLARYHGVVEAARRVHDASLSLGSYHLFRLPEELEQVLHSMVAESGADSKTDRTLYAKDAALEFLRSMTAERMPLLEGPVSLGSIDGLMGEKMIARMVARYTAAFEDGARTFPYMTRA